VQTKTNAEITDKYFVYNKWLTVNFVLFHVKYLIFSPLAWLMALILMTLNTLTI